MKKIFIALLVLGFLGSYSFAEEAIVAQPKDAVKAAETKPAKKKAKRKKVKAEKRAKKEAKVAAHEATAEVKQ